MAGETEEIKTRLNIVDVLSEYLRLEKAGANYRALCPFHNEKSPSFMVNEEKQFWHCFGCQKSGDIFSFVMEMEGVEFREALKVLAEKAGVELKSYNPQKTEEKNRTMEILELATKWYEHQLWNGPGKSRILPYLYDRGLKDETIKEFRLGYAPKGWRNILSFLSSRGFKADEIARTGLVVEKKDNQISKIQDTNFYDRFRERIMFPIADYSGKILGYSARVAPGDDESQAKYVNTPETEVYHKSRVLYGIDKAKNDIKKNDFVLLVEGNMDVIASWQAGLKNTVAVSGTALTGDQLKIIKRYTPKIKMFFDADMAGEMATKKSVKAALAEDFSVEVVTLPSGKDAAELAKDDPKKLLEAVDGSKNVMDYFFERNFEKYDIKKVEDKKSIVDNLLDIISHFGSVVEKSHWLKKLSFDVEIDEQTLTDMLKKATMRERVGEITRESESQNQFIRRSKLEVLADEIIGLVLVSSLAWEEAKKEADNGLKLVEDSLLKNLLQAEKPVDFETLPETINDVDRKRAKKLFVDHKYRLSLNNQPEEIEILDPTVECRTVILEIQKELKKEALQKITKNLAAAESSGDKTAAEISKKEFQKVSEELSVLLK